MNRRRFFIEAGKAFSVVAGAVYIVGCDSNSDSEINSKPRNTSGNQTMTLTAVSTVVAGHSHSTIIPLSDLDVATEISYQSSNSSAHTHDVTLSASQLRTISAGNSVTVVSSNSNGHIHQFTFSFGENDPTDDIDIGY